MTCCSPAPGCGSPATTSTAAPAAAASAGWQASASCLIADRPIPRSQTGSQRMAGSVADGAPEFEAKLASFVRENRLYGAAAGVVHGDELAWSGGAGFAEL